MRFPQYYYNQCLRVIWQLAVESIQSKAFIYEETMWSAAIESPVNKKPLNISDGLETEVSR